MPPYLPVVSIERSRSTQVRLGSGPGTTVPPSIDLGDTVTAPQSGALHHAFYADLGQALVRRDLQRHSAIGQVLVVGVPSNTVWSDLFRASGSGLAVSAGSGFGLNVSAGTIQSRLYGAAYQLPVAAITGGALLPQPPSTGDRTDLVVVDAAGNISVIPGSPATATYEIDSVTTTGTPTGGTFILSFKYNGYFYTTSTIAYNAAASAVASAVLAATGGPALPAASLTGSGGALPTAVTLTASGALEGPITGQTANGAALTGGTSPTATFTQTTAGVGGQAPTLGGNYLPLAYVFVPSTATSSSNYTITNIVLTS